MNDRPLTYRRSMVFRPMAMLALYTGGAAVVDDPAAKAAADAAAQQAADDAKVAAEKKAADEKRVADEKAGTERLAGVTKVLQLPDKSTLDATLPERTAAILSAQDLSPEKAKLVFDHLVQEVATHSERAVAAAKEALKPGNAGWKAEQDGFKAAALADPDLGGGKPEQLMAKMNLAKRVVATVGGSADAVTALEQSGVLNNPSVLKVLVAVGERMKEDEFIVAGAGRQPAPRRDADVLYGKPAS